MRKEKRKGRKGQGEGKAQPTNKPMTTLSVFTHPPRNPTSKTAATSPSQQRRSSLPPSQQCRQSSLPPRMPLLPSAGAPLHIDCSRSRPVQQ